MKNSKISNRQKNKHKFYEQLGTIDRTHNGYANTPCHEAFTCKNCNHFVLPEGAATTHRNHCPK